MDSKFTESREEILFLKCTSQPSKNTPFFVNLYIVQPKLFGTHTAAAHDLCRNYQRQQFQHVCVSHSRVIYLYSLLAANKETIMPNKARIRNGARKEHQRNTKEKKQQRGTKSRQIYKKCHAHGLQKTDQEAEKISTLINLAQQCIFQIQNILRNFFCETEHTQELPHWATIVEIS